MDKQEIIKLAREAGIYVRERLIDVGVFPEILQRFAELVTAKERESRKAAQLETIALREELTKRAMLAEKDAYQRGARDEREACAKVSEGMARMTAAEIGLDVQDAIAHAIRARNNKDNQQ